MVSPVTSPPTRWRLPARSAASSAPATSICKACRTTAPRRSAASTPRKDDCSAGAGLNLAPAFYCFEGNLNVVPANAGTHTPRLLSFGTVADVFLKQLTPVVMGPCVRGDDNEGVRRDDQKIYPPSAPCVFTYSA